MTGHDQEDREAKRADLQGAVSDAEEALEMARWALVVFEFEMGGDVE